jgi:hypothetical protein
MDRFRAFCKPHANLPSGSVILVGSMSHLAKSGLNFYAPILVETMTRMAGKVGPGVNVIPFVPVPIGGIGSETLARDMMDLDSWIVSTGAGQATGLPDTRDTLWRVVLRVRPFRLKFFFASKRIVSEQRSVSHEIRLFASSIRFPFFRFFRLFSLQIFRNYSL